MTKHIKFAAMLLLFFLFCSNNEAWARRKDNVNAPSQQQTSTCKGVVKDSKGETLPGASVVVKNESAAMPIGTTTGIDGDFTLNNVPVGSTLVISFMGFQTQEVKWTGEPLVITLKEDTQTLEEVVVVGFGTQKKVNLTGAVSTVSSKELTARPVNSVVDALQGTIPGMNFSSGNYGGALNSNKSFNIRGKGTIGSGSAVTPLVLIDGMEGDLNTLNPQDIENISVLKDASASSIYGSRAAGGVILVTTKSGKQGKTIVNYNNSFRFNSPLNMPEMMDSYTWALYMNEASINSGGGAWFSDAKLAQIKAAQNDPNYVKMFANGSNRWEFWDEDDILPVGNTDWLKEHFGNSFSQEHTLSVSGGGEKTQFYFSANYLGQDGILRHGDDNKQRYSVTGKLNAQLYPWAKMSYTTRFNRTDFETPSFVQNDGNLFYYEVCRKWPIFPTIDPNGNNTTESFIYDLKNGGKYKTQSDVIAQQIAFQFTPLKGWLINAELNYRINNNNEHTDYQTTYGYDVDNNPFIWKNSTSSVKEYAYKSNYFNPNIYTEYAKTFGDHNFKIMAGFQSEELRYRSITAKQDGIQAGLPTLNTTSSNPSVAGDYESWATAGFFGRLNYDYKGRYLVEANVRYDGSSRFTRNKRWNTFPSFSAGWNIAQENFWENYTSYVNTLKLRASWGKLGNQNTDNWYPFYPTIGYKPNNGNWLINGAKPNTASEAALVSALLTWEKNQTWEIGLDWGAFNNRLTGSFGYFQRKTYDMVGPAPELPDILGTDVPKVNNLDMTSKGWDLQISWRDRVGEFNYGVNLTLSDNQVVIDKYPNPSKDLGQTYYKGAHLGDIWGYTTVGIAQTQEEMDNHLAYANQNQLGSNWAAGDIMYADLNGDGIISSGENTADKPGDRKIIGNSTPRYNFGLNIDAAWKGFDLKLFFQGTLKRDFWPDSDIFWGASGVGKWWAVGYTDHKNYFRADANHPLGQNLNSYYPRADWGGGRNTHAQTRYLQNAAYGRLKNITLGYTLPQRLCNKFYADNLRVFVSAENIWTITNFTGIADPELAGVGPWGLGKIYPLSKTYSVGLSVTF